MPREISSFNFPGEPSQALRDEVDAKIKECLQHYPEIVPPAVSYDLKGHTAGYAIGKDRIRLNLELLNDPRYHANMIADIVPHELAHIITAQLSPWAKAHGNDWKTVMFRLGVPAIRCHNYETVAARTRARPYRYFCQCKEHRVTATLHKRIQEGRVYTCNDCGGRLNP
jgi:SprT protein